MLLVYQVSKVGLWSGQWTIPCIESAQMDNFRIDSFHDMDSLDHKLQRKHFKVYVGMKIGKSLSYLWRLHYTRGNFLVGVCMWFASSSFLSHQKCLCKCNYKLNPIRIFTSFHLLLANLHLPVNWVLISTLLCHSWSRDRFYITLVFLF